MPRRLGDDPLARAKGARTVVASPAGPQPSSRTSYNDVFFQRRADENDPVVTLRPQEEAPEITEISEIPEIREVAVAPEATAVPSGPVELPAAPVGPKEAEVAPAPPASFIEEVVAKLNATAASPAVVNEDIAVVKGGPTGLPAEPRPPETGDGAAPEEGGGLLKRFIDALK